MNNSNVSVVKKQPSFYNLSFISSLSITLSKLKSVNLLGSVIPSNDGHLNGIYNVFNGRLNTEPLYSIGVVISACYMTGFFVNYSI